MAHIHKSSFIAPTAVIIGDVTIGKNCGVYPHAVIRGDESSIVIGDGSNIQDCCVIHTDSEHRVSIGENVTIGHAAIIHGATISDDCLIGIHATVLNGAQIDSGSIVGACALVTEGMVVPKHSLVLGIPGKVVKQDPQFVDVIRKNAEVYHHLAEKHKKGIFPIYSSKDD
ncbi:MAG TPA: gamma carbonic anhydrase family protein [Thermoplasmata archaeon]|jgi:carbonic anhydrase/acetyltransferase-like protein (isoleucine patch superfamily)|nr:MAG TPA: gamma carbonic anhydrase family protein [Thermoplasmata archaeon]